MWITLFYHYPKKMLTQDKLILGHTMIHDSYIVNWSNNFLSLMGNNYFQLPCSVTIKFQRALFDSVSSVMACLVGSLLALLICWRIPTCADHEKLLAVGTANHRLSDFWKFGKPKVDFRRKESCIHNFFSRLLVWRFPGSKSVLCVCACMCVVTSFLIINPNLTCPMDRFCRCLSMHLIKS